MPCNLKEMSAIISGWWFMLVMRHAAKLCADTPFMFVEVETIDGQEYLRDNDGTLWTLNRVPVAKMSRVKISCEICAHKNNCSTRAFAEHCEDFKREE